VNGFQEKGSWLGWKEAKLNFDRVKEGTLKTSKKVELRDKLQEKIDQGQV
jgi:hypothetical protein